jgi:hypothetical protein
VPEGVNTAIHDPPAPSTDPKPTPPSATPATPARADSPLFTRAADRLGSRDTLNDVLDWAAKTLPPHERTAYQRRLDDPGTSDAALDELAGRYAATSAMEGYDSLEAFQAGARAATQSRAAAEAHMRRARLTPNDLLQIES